MQEARQTCAGTRNGEAWQVQFIPFFSLVLLAAAGPASLPAQEPAPPAGEVAVFATDALCGQVLALTVDDQGRVEAAVSRRSFGRGTLAPGPGEKVLLAEDRGIFSLTAREEQLQTWQEKGQLASQIKQRVSFFPEVAGKPMDFFTRYPESITLLKDADGDGHAEAAAVIAEGFRNAGDGPGSALLALPGGQWFYGCPPVLWKLQDRNGDDKAEIRNAVATGFGLRMHPEGHGMSALLEAPDGWIYFGTGDRGYALSEAAARIPRALGSGAIFRCRADGSGLETVATGLRHPTGLAMDTMGHLFALDAAAPGGKVRLLQIIPGADFGWQAECVSAPGEGTWFREGMESGASGELSGDQPAWCLPPLAAWEGGASSLEVLADGSLLAADRQGNGQGGLFSLALVPRGSTFEMKERHPVWQGGAVMATSQGLDGGVYFVDWGRAVEATSTCEIKYWPSPGRKAPAEPTVQLLTKKIPALAVRELKLLLENPSARVRLRAQQRLSSMSFQDSLEALLQVARRHASPVTRLQALWGAGALARREPALTNELLPFLTDPDPAVRAVTASLVGQADLPDAPVALRRALMDESLEVRVAAAGAVARLKPPRILKDLLAAAAGNATRDPAVRSTLAYALANCIPAAVLTEIGPSQEEAEARLTCVHALRRLRAPGLEKFLADPDNIVRAEAARAIYDLPVFVDFPMLAALLDQMERPLPEAVARRALAVAAHFGTATDVARVARLAVAPGTSAALQLEALTLLENWDRPAAVEPVWNRPAFPLARLPGMARSALRDTAAALLHAADARVASKATALANLPGLTRPPAATLLARAQDASLPLDERLAAVESLTAKNELTVDGAKTLCQPLIPPEVRAAARTFLMKHDPKNGVLFINEAFLAGTIVEKQAAVRTLNRLPGNGNDNEKLLLELARRLGRGAVEPGIQVEVLEALQRRDIQSRSPWRRATDSWNASLPMDRDSLAAWRMTMADGDPVAGRLVFESHPDANCTSCHAIQGVGGSRGPDLDKVASRLTAGGLLQSLIHPGAKLARGFETIPGPPGGTPVLPEVPAFPADAADPPAPDGPAGPVSIMPPAGTLLTLRELRDLIAYLRTLQPTPP